MAPGNHALRSNHSPNRVSVEIDDVAPPTKLGLSYPARRQCEVRERLARSSDTVTLIGVERLRPWSVESVEESGFHV
jgi:hypothetical protein